MVGQSVGCSHVSSWSSWLLPQVGLVTVLVLVSLSADKKRSGVITRRMTMVSMK